MIFKKKEPCLIWGDWKILPECDGCGHLAEYGEEEFYKTCCPKCGGRDIRKAVGRHQYYWLTGGIIHKKIYVSKEVKERIEEAA
jgi:predicted  nucleic acid-binding Zn-ribbon protein